MTQKCAKHVSPVFVGYHNIKAELGTGHASTKTARFTPLEILCSATGIYLLHLISNGVNGLDWTIMEGVWFTNDATADLNKDGIACPVKCEAYFTGVNSIDFSLINQNWGRTQ